MSRTIDERVVEMQFDNKQFEKGANETIGTLGKLTQALNLGSSINALSTVAQQTSGLTVEFGNMSNAVQSIANKFTVLGQIGMNVLSNLTNKATNWLTSTVYELSFLKQATVGWDKYAQKTSSVQTIMAATTRELADEGERMKYVNEQLEKLNWFTDETSYNFVDMVNNIGKFTSNNIALNDSVTAMQGIATWAAISGANSQEASRAMYNLSQAMAVGSVKLMDWKSIENANMATSEFKQTAIDTAVAMGKLVKVNDKYYTKVKHTEVSVKSFNQTLSENWFSSEVLMSTLDKYGGFAVALGDAVEETGLLTSETLRYIDDYKAGILDVSQVAKETGVEAARLDEIFKNLSDDTYDLGRRSFKAAQEAKTFSEAIAATTDAVSTQWMTTFELIFGDYEHAKVLWTELAEELWNVFASGGEARLSVLRVWNQGAGNVSMINSVKNAYGALKAIIESIGDTFRDIFPPMTGERLLEITKKVENATVRFKNLFVPAENVDKILQDIAKTSGKVVTEFNGVQDTVDSAALRIQKIKDTFKGLFSVLEVLKTAFITFIDKAIKPLTKYIVPVLDAILDLTSKGGRALSAWADDILENNKIVQFFNDVTAKIKEFIDILLPAKDTINEFGEIVVERFNPITAIVNMFKIALEKLNGIIGKIKPGLTTIGDLLKSAWKSLSEQLYAGFKSLDFGQSLDIVNTGLFGILVFAIKSAIDKIKELFQPKKLNSVIDSINDFVDGVTGALSKFSEKMSIDKISQIAKAIAILAASLFVLSLVDSKKLSAATVNLTAIMGAIFLLMKGLNSFTNTNVFASKELGSISTILIKMAAAILVLSFAIKTVSSVEADKLLDSVLVISALLAELTLITKALSSKDAMKTINGSKILIKMSEAILILAAAIKIISSIELDPLFNSILVITILISELTLVALILSKNQGKMNASAKTLVGMSAAIVVLAGAVFLFGKMPYEVITQGLIGVSAALLGVTAFIRMAGDAKHILATSIAIVAISGSLIVLAGAVAIFGNMKIATLVKGLAGLAGVLIPIALAAKAMTGTLTGAASMVIMAGAIMLLAPALLMLGGMDLEKIGNMVLALAATFATLGVISLTLGGMLPVMLGMSAVIAMLGVGMLALGAGVTSLSVGLATFASSLDITVEAVIDGISVLILRVLETIAGTLPLIADIIVGLVVAICDTLVGTVPKLVDTVVDILVEICKALTLHIGTIVDAAIKLAIGFINGLAQGIADNAGPLMDSVANLIDAVLILALEALKTLVGWIPGLGKDLSKDIDKAIADVRGEMDARSIGTTMVDEIEEGAKDETPKLTKYMAFLSDSEMLGKLRERIADGSFEDIGTDELHAIIDGILEEEPELMEKIDEITGGTIEAFDEVPEELKESGKESVLSYASGLDAYKDEAYRKAYEIGAYTAQGMEQGITDKMYSVVEQAKNMVRYSLRDMRYVAQEHSPSKATMEIGWFMGEGLAIGLGNATNEVSKASDELVTEGLSSLQNAAALATSLFDTTVDLDPVIRPVIDLTEIQNGADQVNGLLDFNSQVGLSFGSGISSTLQSPYGANQTANAVTVNFNVTTQGPLTESDIRKYGREIADVVNYELGRRVG